MKKWFTLLYQVRPTFCIAGYIWALDLQRKGTGVIVNMQETTPFFKFSRKSMLQSMLKYKSENYIFSLLRLTLWLLIRPKKIPSLTCLKYNQESTQRGFALKLPVLGLAVLVMNRKVSMEFSMAKLMVLFDFQFLWLLKRSYD